MKRELKPETLAKFQAIWHEAMEAAEIAAMGEPDAFPCGFAWITVPGRGNFAKFAKEYLDAHKNYGAPGFNIWYTNVYTARGQSMDTHIKACNAAVEILNKYGIKAEVHSRMD